MGSFDDLPADQRAVLQMVLQRGRSYDEIATVLSIERSAVRQRALDACARLTADAAEPGPEHALVTDYLLGQLPDQVAEQVYIYLEAAGADGEWAQALAARLTPLAPRPLPELPVAVPLDSDEIDAAATRSGPDAQPAAESDATPAPIAAPPAVGETPPRQPPAPPSPKPARRWRPAPGATRPLWRNPLLLGVVAAIVVVVVVILATSGGSSRPKPSTSASRTQTATLTGASTTGTSTTTAEPQILAALNLTSPVGATQTLGVAQVVREDGVVGIVIDAQGVPANSSHNAYGVWLYNSPTSHRFVGFVPNLVGKNGKLATEGKLPAGASAYKQLLITLETQQHPKAPGEVVLSGPFRETS